MGQKGLISVSTFSVAKEYNFSRIDDDIILFDNFGKLPVPCEPSRNMGLIIGLCLQGSFRYTADTVEQCVHAGEAMIIHEGQVVDNYQRSDDVEGIAIMMWRTRQTLWSAVQMLTQKLCCQTIHDCPKVVPLHYESE